MADDSNPMSSTVLPLANRPQVHGFVWCSGIFCILVAMWTGLRIYSRRMRLMPLGIEDLLYNVSVIAFYGFVVSLYMATYLGGIGYHMSQLNKFHIARLTQSFLVIQSLYGLSMCTIKWSMLFMLKRIFAVRYFRIITWIIIALQAGWLVMTVLIGFLICRPLAKNWDPTAQGVCGNRIAGYTAVSVINVLVDCLMLILPLPMIFRLQVKPSHRWALLGIFGIGVITIVFSAIRLASIRTVDFDDFSYTVPMVMIWTTAENGVIIIVASSALLRPVFDKMLGRLTSLSGNRSKPMDSDVQYDCETGANRSLERESRVRKVSAFAGNGDGNQSDDVLELGVMRPHSWSDIRTVGSRQPILKNPATLSNEH
ncbi:hypothetical protein N0V82_006247 [Gnomoniopsis sp. IMI 355080]|nr:hypothetical protein N0V82_006247 [Gnomoniopsis sp. IMI 355080]